MLLLLFVHDVITDYDALCVRSISDSAAKNEKAACTVQKAWRTMFKYRTTTIYVKHAVVDCGLSGDHVKSISFEALVQNLKTPAVIAKAKKFFFRLNSQAVFRHGSEDFEGVGTNVNVRVLMAAFMIAYRPTHVFETMGPLEQALLASAANMLAVFNDIASRFVAGGRKFTFQMVPHDATRPLLGMMRQYLGDFRQWKVPDEAKLSRRIKNALVALYQAREHLPPDEPADSPLNVEFRTQIDRLREKLLQIAGQAAVVQFDAERAAGEGLFRQNPGNNNNEGHRFPARMTNEQLAHELLICPTFQLSEDGSAGGDLMMFRQMRETFHRAFWGSLADDMRLAEPCYVRVFRVMDEVREGIVDLNSNTGINEAMDMPHIRAQVATGLFTWDNTLAMSTAVVAILKDLTCLLRVADFDAKWAEVYPEMLAAETRVDQAGAFAKALEFFLTRINLCRIDAANARLRLIAPTIAEHGIDYERGKFQDRVRDEALTLDHSTSWITKSLEFANDLVERVRNGMAGSVLEAHAHAVTLLANGTIYENEFVESTVPETLMFDFHRIVGFRGEFKSIVQTSMALFVATGDNTVFANVSAAVNAMGPGAAIVPADLSLPDAMARTLQSSLETTSPMHSVLSRRLTAIVRNRIITGNINAARVSILPVALPPNVQARADKLVSTIVRMATVNRQVHNAIYDEIFPAAARAVAAAHIAA